MGHIVHSETRFINTQLGEIGLVVQEKKIISFVIEFFTK